MPIRYRKISGADLAKGIEAAGVTPAQFAALFGAQPRRVDKWLNDKMEIPHAVALFVGLIADPLILEKALVITQYMVDKDPPSPDRETRRNDAKAARGERAGKTGERERPGRPKDRRPEAPPRPAEEAPATETASRTR